MRLAGFDYSRPMFYMVTLKCLPGRQALSTIVEPGKCEMNPTTRAMVNCIRTFHQGCAAIEPIECFTIMPDHVHLLFLSLYEPSAAKPDNATLYRRCHEMGDLAVAALTPRVEAQPLGDRTATGRAEARPSTPPLP